MKAMLLKDLLLIRRQYAKLLLILFICILAGTIISTDLTPVYLPFIAFFICSVALSTFSMDENNHGYQTILSFPIQRKAYIQSKNLLFLLLFFSCLLLFLPFYLLSFQAYDFYLLFVICACFPLFFALALLLITAFGPYKGRIALGICAGIFCYGIVSLQDIYQNSLSQFSFSLFFFVLTLLLSLLIYFLSMQASIHIFRKKSSKKGAVHNELHLEAFLIGFKII